MSIVKILDTLIADFLFRLIVVLNMQFPFLSDEHLPLTSHKINKSLVINTYTLTNGLFLYIICL